MLDLVGNHIVGFLLMRLILICYLDKMPSEHLRCNAVPASDLDHRTGWCWSSHCDNSPVHVCNHGNHNVNVSYMYQWRSERRYVLSVIIIASRDKITRLFSIRKTEAHIISIIFSFCLFVCLFVRLFV